MASKVQGLDRLLRQISALPNSVRAAMSDEMADGANDLAEIIKRAAPVDQGDLRSSVGACEGEPPKTSATGAMRARSREFGQREAILSKAGLLFSIFVGNDKVFYPRWVEFGTAPSVKGERVGARASDVKQHKTHGRKAQRTHSGTRAQPFFFPSIRAWTKPMRSRVVRAANRAAKEVAALR